MNPIRILIVEDHPVFRDGLNLSIASQPDMCVIGQARTAPEAVEQFRTHKPDVTLMDQRLAGTTGTDALITIREEFPLARIIMLTTSEGDLIIRRALRAGALAYVLKSTPEDELLKIIRSVHAGHKHIPCRRSGPSSRASGGRRPNPTRVRRSETDSGRKPEQADRRQALHCGDNGQFSYQKCDRETASQRQDARRIYRDTQGTARNLTW